MSDLFAVSADLGGEAMWDAACESLPCSWFLHSSHWRAYRRARGDRDLSFAVSDGAEILAVVPIFQDHKTGAFTDGGEGLPAPAMKPGMNGRLEPFIAHEIESLAKRYGAKAGVWRSAPLAENPSLLSLFPGAAFRHWQSVMIDLTMSPADRWHDVRASYRNLINRPKTGLYRVAVVEQIGTVGDGLAFAAYKRLHRGAFGDSVRSDASFNLQREWIAERLAFLVTAETTLGAHYVAAAYVLLYKGGAYYMSGPSVERNLQHAVLWAAVENAATRGAARFEVGWTGHAEDDKGKGVEYFKSGFSSRRATVVEVRVEWTQ